MENIYIGARYVPLFYTAPDGTNAWTAGVQYEPLTIVTYNNQSYTSKIPVPASVGNPADNPDYWILTGGYNAQVELYRQDVEAYRADVEELKNSFAGKARHFIVIADSYGTHNGAGAGLEVTYNLYDRLLTYIGWSADYIHYSAENGAGFCNGRFLAQLNALSIAESVRDSVTDIYVVGGWNDESDRDGVDAATFASAATSFKAAAAAAYPNAKLHACFVAWSYQDTRPQTAIRLTRDWYKNLTKTGWLFNDNLQYVLHRSDWFIGGNVHPNQNGVDQLSDALAQYILTGSYSAKYEAISTTQSGLIGTLPANASIRVQQTMDDGLVYVQFNIVRGGLTLTEPQQIILDGNHALTLFKIDGQTIVKGYVNNCIASVAVNLYNGSENITVPALLRIANQQVSLVFDYYFEGATYKTVSNVTKISIPNAGFTCKAW